MFVHLINFKGYVLAGNAIVITFQLNFRSTKANFIRAKYQMLSFVHRLPCRDDDEISTADLSQVSYSVNIHSFFYIYVHL